MNVTAIDKIDVSKVLKEIESPQLWKFASAEWYRIISPYTPYRTGNLEESAIIGNGTITYNAPYAPYVYLGKNMKFRPDHNPKASARWDERAIQEKQDEKLAQAVQGYVNKNI